MCTCALTCICMHIFDVVGNMHATTKRFTLALKAPFAFEIVQKAIKQMCFSTPGSNVFRKFLWQFLKTMEKIFVLVHTNLYLFLIILKIFPV